MRLKLGQLIQRPQQLIKTLLSLKSWQRLMLKMTKSEKQSFLSMPVKIDEMERTCAIRIASPGRKSLPLTQHLEEILAEE